MSREKGGCPTGTTKKRKHSTNLAIIGAKNEITKKYKRELDNRTHKVRMPKGRLTAINREVKEKNKLGADIVIAGKTIRQRISRRSIYSDGKGGHSSPLLPLELTFVDTIVQMARICQSLAPS